MRNSGQNRPRAEFEGSRQHRQMNRDGRRRHRPPEGKHQGPPRARRNRRGNPNQRQKNHALKGRRPQFRHRRGPGWSPDAGFTGFDDRFEVEVELPGVEEKDISVAVAGEMLLVKGKKHRKHSEEKHNFSRSGLKYGKFHRAFPIPPIAKTDGIKADFKDGILTIAIPKKEEAKPKEIPINADV